AMATDAPGWLLLTSSRGADTALAETIAAALNAAGQRTLTQRDVDPTQLDAVLAQANSQLGALHGILHLDGLSDAPADPDADLQAQVRRCGLAAGLAQALERANSKATLWLITVGAAQHL